MTLDSVLQQTSSAIHATRPVVVLNARKCQCALSVTYWIKQDRWLMDQGAAEHVTLIVWNAPQMELLFVTPANVILGSYLMQRITVHHVEYRIAESVPRKTHAISVRAALRLPRLRKQPAQLVLPVAASAE